MSDEMISMVLDEARDKMAKAVAHARSEFTGVRTGRAAPALVERSRSTTTAPRCRSSRSPASPCPRRMLVISPYDKNSLGAIEKAIQLSGLGLAPATTGRSSA